VIGLIDTLAQSVTKVCSDTIGRRVTRWRDGVDFGLIWFVFRFNFVRSRRLSVQYRALSGLTTQKIEKNMTTEKRHLGSQCLIDTARLSPPPPQFKRREHAWDVSLGRGRRSGGYSSTFEIFA